MCGDCWNAAMGAPAAAVAARFAWVGYKDRIPFLRRRPDETATRCQAPRGGAEEEPVGEVADAELVEAGSPPP